MAARGRSQGRGWCWSGTAGARGDAGDMSGEHQQRDSSAGLALSWTPSSWGGRADQMTSSRGQNVGCAPRFDEGDQRSLTTWPGASASPLDKAPPPRCRLRRAARCELGTATASARRFSPGDSTGPDRSSDSAGGGARVRGRHRLSGSAHEAEGKIDVAYYYESGDGMRPNVAPIERREHNV